MAQPPQHHVPPPLPPEYEKRLREAQEFFRQRVPQGISLVEEVFKMRREEFELAEQRYQRWFGVNAHDEPLQRLSEMVVNVDCVQTTR